MVAAAVTKPNAAIAATQSGEKITPPITSAVIRHAESRRAGAHEPRRDDRIDCRGAHRAPTGAAKHARHQCCHRAIEIAQWKTPATMQSAPRFVTAAPSRHRCNAGRFAPTATPMRKWTVTDSSDRCSQGQADFPCLVLADSRIKNDYGLGHLPDVDGDRHRLGVPRRPDGHQTQRITPGRQAEIE